MMTATARQQRPVYAMMLILLQVVLVAIVIGAPTTDNECGFPPYPQQYIAYHLLDGNITIDGKLDDAAWSEVEWSTPFVDIMTDIIPRYTTRMKMRYDDKYLYIGAHLEEPQIWAYMTEHNSVIFRDNDFEVFIDPDGDTHYYKEYEMNAKNITWELMLGRPYDDGGPVCPFEMLPDMINAVYVYPDNAAPNNVHTAYTAWEVEMAFPLHKLAHTLVPESLVPRVHVPPHQDDLWRINFSRVEYHVLVINNTFVKDPTYHAEDNWVWSRQSAIAMHRPDQWGYLQFSRVAVVNTTKIVRDPLWYSQQALMQIYYAQAAWYSSDDGQGRYSTNLTQLGLPLLANATCLQHVPIIAVDYHTWHASVEIKDRFGAEVTHHIRADRLTRVIPDHPEAYHWPQWATGGLIGIVVGAGLLFLIQYTSRKMSEPSLIVAEDHHEPLHRTAADHMDARD